MTTISCAMIVRDAEKTIRTALESVKGHVDEIIVVDTGSTDSTPQIASEYATHLFSHEWKDDFSEARQFAHDMCSSEWVFFLDADDEVHDARALRRRVQHAPADMDAYMIRYVLATNEAGVPTTEFYRERLVRKDRMKWVGRVHEVMVPFQEPCRYERFDHTWVLHRGHGDHLGSLHRNIRLLELDVATESPDTRSLFYLGRDYVQVGRYVEGIATLERYLDVGTWQDERFLALTMIGHALRVMKRFYEAYASDIRLSLCQPQWPQTWFLLAQDAYYLNLWSASVMYCEIGQGLPMAITNLFQSPTDVESGWMIFQVVALCKCDRLADAVALTNRALELLPNDAMHLANAAFFANLLAQRQQQDTAAGAG